MALAGDVVREERGDAAVEPVALLDAVGPQRRGVDVGLVRQRAVPRVDLVGGGEGGGGGVGGGGVGGRRRQRVADAAGRRDGDVGGGAGAGEVGDGGGGREGGGEEGCGER